MSISERIEHQGVVDLILFSDGVHFYMSGNVNKQNMQFWAYN